MLDGEGLTMTENQDLNKKGETLEITGVRNVEDETRKQKKSPNAKGEYFSTINIGIFTSIISNQRFIEPSQWIYTGRRDYEP